MNNSTKTSKITKIASVLGAAIALPLLLLISDASATGNSTPITFATPVAVETVIPSLTISELPSTGGRSSMAIDNRGNIPDQGVSTDCTFYCSNDLGSWIVGLAITGGLIAVTLFLLIMLYEMVAQRRVGRELMNYQVTQEPPQE